MSTSATRTTARRPVTPGRKPGVREQAALETQDPNTIRKARQALDDVLRQVESESFL